MLVERVHTLLGLPVPQPHRLVVTTGDNQAAIGGEPGSTDPVAVITQAELELLTIHRPHLVTIATEERCNNLIRSMEIQQFSVTFKSSVLCTQTLGLQYMCMQNCTICNLLDRVRSTEVQTQLKWTVIHSYSKFTQCTNCTIHSEFGVVYDLP